MASNGSGGGKRATAITRRNIRDDRQGENSIKFTTQAVKLRLAIDGNQPGRPVGPGNSTYRGGR